MQIHYYVQHCQHHQRLEKWELCIEDIESAWEALDCILLEIGHMFDGAELFSLVNESYSKVPESFIRECDLSLQWTLKKLAETRNRLGGTVAFNNDLTSLATKRLKRMTMRQRPQMQAPNGYTYTESVATRLSHNYSALFL